MSSVSVVIPTLNEEGYLDKLLLSLRQQTHPVSEILVVDGGSTDGTITLASTFGDEVRIISAKPPVGAQRQLGLENAHGDVVIFLDADTILPPDFVERSLAEMTARKLDVACPRYIPNPSSAVISATFWFFNLIFFVAQKVLPSGAGGCILTKRDFALHIGGFRNDLIYEDIEFIRRAGRRGRFGMLRCSVMVSDRRFRKFGVGRTILKYLLLSLFFSFGLFKLASVVSYPFGKYKQDNR